MPDENLPDQQNQHVPVKHYLEILFRYRLLVTIIVLGGTALGILCAAFFIRPMNVWDGTKVIRLRNPWAELNALDGALTTGPSREAFYIEAEIEQFYDQTILGAVVDRCDLANQQKELHKEFKKTAQGRLRLWLSDNIPFVFGTDSPTDEQYRQAAIHVLGKSLVIEPTRLSRQSSPVLSIQYANPDHRKVAQVIEVLLDVYQEHKAQEFAEGSAAKKRRALLQTRLERLQREYEQQRDVLQQEYDALGLPFDAEFTFLLNITQQEVLQLDGQEKGINSQIRRMQAQIAQLQAQHKSILQAGSASLVKSTAESPALQRLLVQYSQYSDRLNGVLLDLTSPDLPSYKRQLLEGEREDLKREIRILEDRIDELRKQNKIRPPEAVRVEWELAFHEAGLKELKKQAAAIREQRSAKERELKVLQVGIARVSVMREEFHRTRDRYEQELIRREDREIYDAARKEMAYLKEVTTTVKLEEMPRALHRLSRSLLILVGFFGSLLIACACAFLLGHVMDASLHSSTQTEKALRVRVLAMIPEVKRGVLA